MLLIVMVGLIVMVLVIFLWKLVVCVWFCGVDLLELVLLLRCWLFSRLRVCYWVVNCSCGLIVMLLV